MPTFFINEINKSVERNELTEMNSEKQFQKWNIRKNFPFSVCICLYVKEKLNIKGHCIFCIVVWNAGKIY